MRYIKQIKAWFFYFFFYKVSMHDFVSEVKKEYLKRDNFLCNTADALFENGGRVMHGILLQHFTGADDSCKGSGITYYYEMHVGWPFFDGMPYEKRASFAEDLRLDVLDSALAKPNYWIKLKWKSIV